MVNKAKCEEELSAPLVCFFDFKFSETEGNEIRSQVIVFDTLGAVA
jgi:hypothetical protein